MARKIIKNELYPDKSLAPRLTDPVVDTNEGMVALADGETKDEVDPLSLITSENLESELASSISICNSIEDFFSRNQMSLEIYCHVGNAMLPNTTIMNTVEQLSQNPEPNAVLI